MFGLLPITKIISTIAGIYAFAFLVVYLCFGWFGWTLHTSVVFSGATLVNFGLLIFFYAGWRRLWAAIPQMNHWFYPDLNGAWFASINWVSGEKMGHANGKVQIKQDFFKVSIEMDAERSESRTIALSVRKDPESGRPLLHYIYEVREKYTSPGQNQTYQGAASLFVDSVSNKDLVGNYFTNRGTGGRFHFCRKPKYDEE